MRREVKEEQPEEGVSNALLLPGLVSNAGTHASQATPSEQVALLAPSARWAADNGMHRTNFSRKRTSVLSA